VLYFDTSALLAVYTARSQTAVISDFLRSEGKPIGIWSFTEVEFESAMKQLIRQKELTQAQRLDIQTLYLSDQKLGRVNIKEIEDVRDIHDIAKSIIAKPKYAEKALDAIHVAAAIKLKSTTFFSLDKRQRAMAKREKLTIFPEKIIGE
jgi:predicted nucleic acid-binding protein